MSLRTVVLTTVLLLAACDPTRVRIEELPPEGYAVTVEQSGTRDCLGKARRKAADEARHYCEAHGRRVRSPRQVEAGDDSGCTVELRFACGLPR